MYPTFPCTHLNVSRINGHKVHWTKKEAPVKEQKRYFKIIKSHRMSTQNQPNELYHFWKVKLTNNIMRESTGAFGLFIKNRAMKENMYYVNGKNPQAMYERKICSTKISANHSVSCCLQMSTISYQAWIIIVNCSLRPII